VVGGSASASGPTAVTVVPSSSIFGAALSCICLEISISMSDECRGGVCYKSMDQWY